MTTAVSTPLSYRHAEGSAPLVQASVLFLAFWTPVQNSLTRAYPVLPAVLVWTDEVLVMMLAVVAFLRAIRRSPRLWLDRTDILLMVFVLAGALSTWLNHVPLATAAAGYRSLLQYVPVYYVLAQERIDEAHLRRFVWVVLAIGLLQLPVTLLQMTVAYVKSGWIDDDLIVGTFNFNQANTLSYYVLCVSFLLLGIFRYRRRVAPKRPWQLAAMVIPFVAGSSRAALMSLPVVLAWSERDVIRGALRRRRHLRRFMLLVAASLIMFVSVTAYLYLRGYDIGRLSPRQLFADSLEVNARGNGGRLLHVAYTVNTLRETRWGLWVGMGPGMYTSGAGYFLDSPGRRAITDSFGRQLYGERYRPGMIVDVPGERPAVFQLRDFSQATSTMGEWGIAGALVFGMVIVTLMRKGSAARRSHSTCATTKVLGSALEGSGALCLLTVLIMSLWEEQAIAFLLWSTAGLIAGHRRAERRAHSS